LSLTRTVKGLSESFGSSSHWPAAAGIALIAIFLVQLGRNRSGGIRATLTGTAAGLMLGIADAFTRRTVEIIDGRHPLHVLLHWPGYATVVASIIALWLMQNAFNAAPLHASLPAVTAAEPTAGIVLGVVVFGDRIHVTPWLVAVQIVGVVIMVTGVILVARAPVFRALRLRELPHAALELLQHLPPDGNDDPPTDGEGDDPGDPGHPGAPEAAATASSRPADQQGAAETAAVIGPASRPGAD
jgi:multidrug transporter EmrE-like cation transporter